MASLACVVLLAGVLAVAWSRRGGRATAAEQQEALLYSHIPGTPARQHKGGTVQHTTPWAEGRGSVAALKAAGPVAKKLSNLPA